jgi:hypothetical protein
VEAVEMKQNWSKHDTLVAIIFPVCLGIGTAIGALIHNIGVGLAIGACIGTIFSLIGYSLVKPDPDQEDLPHN